MTGITELLTPFRPGFAAQEPVPPDPPSPTEAVDLLTGKLAGWIEETVRLLPNLALAVVVLVLFWLLSRLARWLLGRALEATPMPAPLRNLATTVLGVVVLVGGLFFALGVLGLDKTVTSLLAGVGIVGLALGFAFQDIAANFMSGVLLSVRRPIRVGDVVETNDFFGTVEEINLRSTVVRRPTGQIVYIPNKLVFENPLINYSRLGKRRVDLAVGVSYADDLEKAKKLAMAAVEDLPERDKESAVELFYTGFGGSSIDLVLRFWVPFSKQSDYLAAQSEAIVRVKRAFDEGGVSIPFPIRTLDFGILGGKELGESLAPALERAPGRPGSATPPKPS